MEEADEGGDEAGAEAAEPEAAEPEVQEEEDPLRAPQKGFVTRSLPQIVSSVVPERSPPPWRSFFFLIFFKHF